jgi:hypothetical protein
VTLLEFDTVCVNYLDSHFLSPSPTELTKMPLCVWDLDVEIIFNLHLKLKCDVQVGCGGGQEQRRRRGAGAGAAQVPSGQRMETQKSDSGCVRRPAGRRRRSELADHHERSRRVRTR